jgi:heme-degrading monooxygenase HmoA
LTASDTLARWYVKQGREADFIRAWSGELGGYFLSLPGSRWGTLLQSTEDPRHFYSFGPWDTLEDIRNMRSDPRTQEVFGVLAELCDEMQPGVFRHIATVGETQA